MGNASARSQCCSGPPSGLSAKRNLEELEEGALKVIPIHQTMSLRGLAPMAPKP